MLIGVWRIFCSSRWFFTPEIIVCCIISYTVLTMYMADNTEISIRYVRLLNYTFYPLRDLPHKLPTTCSTQGSRHNQYSNSISNSEIVRGVQIMPRSKHFLFASCGPKFPLLGVTLIGAYGLNLPVVGKLLVPSIPVKLSHMDISVETWYNFQPHMHHFPFEAFHSYKKGSITWTLSWRNNGYKNQ